MSVERLWKYPVVTRDLSVRKAMVEEDKSVLEKLVNFIFRHSSAYLQCILSIRNSQATKNIPYTIGNTGVNTARVKEERNDLQNSENSLSIQITLFTWYCSRILKEDIPCLHQRSLYEQSKR